MFTAIGRSGGMPPMQNFVEIRCDRRFSADVTRMRKFDYYSANHTLGAATCIVVYGENPTTNAFPLLTLPVRSPCDKFGPSL